LTEVGRVGTRERKKAAMRQALVDSAARLFAEHGVDATTMDDIAAAAGTSRTSVFNYFGHKEMILCEIGARYVRELAEDARIAQIRSPRARMKAMTDVVAAFAEREPELVAAVAREMTHPDPERRRCASETMRYGEMVESALDSLATTGHLRHPRRRASYARMMVDMLAGAVVRAGGDYPVEQLRDELHRNVDLLMDGVLAPR
jgi:AcrR family transcriptional regulator